MEQCTSCGATLSSAMSWCGQCYAPRGRAATTNATAASVGVPARMTRPVPAAAVLPPTVRRSRWRKTQTTFGPVGRVLWTFALVVPVPLFLVAGVIGDIFAFGVAGIWAFVIMPMGLRAVWRDGQVIEG
jgi:hypothetical protein